jgi:xylulokinase
MTTAKITDSSLLERSSGPQAKTVFPKTYFEWQRIAHSPLPSSFLTTMLCADGKVRGPDEADASGMNLWDLSESGGRQWNEALSRSVVGGNEGEAKRLRQMLGSVEQDSRVSAGTIGGWFQARYGFPQGESCHGFGVSFTDSTSADCQVAYLTGDNPTTLLSFALES